MPNTAKAIPSLLHGISQQPPQLRRDVQADLQENAFPSPVDGLIKRPGTTHIKRFEKDPLGGGAGVPTAYDADSQLHVINRDSTERYMIYARCDASPEIVVVGLADGKNYQVHAPGGGAPDLTYITSMSDEKNLKMVTVQDFTFFTNAEKTVAMTGATSGAHPEEAGVFVRQGAFVADYTVRATENGGTPRTVTWTTGDGSTAGTEDQAQSTDIALELKTLLDAFGEFTNTQQGSVVRIIPSATPFDTFEVEDSLSNSGLVGIYKTIDFFTRLPTFFIADHKVQVLGDPDQSEDDYYVKFVGDAGGGGLATGHWEETIKWDTATTLDSATMPHQLVRKQDDGGGSITGTPNEIYFEFGPVTWIDRLVGDTTSNPDPSFVGNKIQDTFFWQNRMGFLSKDAVILSETGSFFNFFRTTVRTVVDSDPIDAIASTKKVSNLLWALPTKDALLLFSDRTQFAMRGLGFLGPNSYSLLPTSDFEIDPQVEPQPSKRGALLASRNGDFTGLFEYLQSDSDAQVFISDDLSAHAPKYVAGRGLKIANSLQSQMAVVRGATDLDKLYCYKYFWDGPQLAQAAWHTYTFTRDVVHCEFVENDLYLALHDTVSGELFLERMEVADGTTDPSSTFVLALDRRFDDTEGAIPESFDLPNNRTVVSPPYDLAAGDVPQAVTRDTGSTNGGGIITVVGTDTATPGAHKIYLQGDQTGVDYWVGQQIQMRYRFSEPFLRESKGQGLNAITAGLWNLTSGRLGHSDSAFYQVRVAIPGTDDAVQEFSASVLGAGPPTDQLNLETGEFDLFVGGPSDKITVTIENDLPLPCKLQTMEWEGQYNSRSRRAFL